MELLVSDDSNTWIFPHSVIRDSESDPLLHPTLTSHSAFQQLKLNIKKCFTCMQSTGNLFSHSFYILSG